MTRIRGEQGADWISEGLAEFYGIEALRRAGGMTDARHADTLKALRGWSKNVTKLSVPRSAGEVTARDALLLVELDNEIKAATKNKKDLDDVVRILIKAGGKVSNTEFRQAAEKVLGRPAKALQSKLI